MCLYPKLITNPKYKPNKKNGGKPPEIKDIRVALVPIGCGECMECRKQKANGWRLRLLEDIKEHKNGIFVTLTFSNEQYGELAKLCKGKGYNLDNEVATLATRRFLERWRKETGKSVRHWLITEIGGGQTEHIHLHGIIYTDDYTMIKKHWKYGYVWDGKKENEKRINYVNEKTINYIIKYCTKVDFKHRYYKPIILTSAGIGNNYVKTHNYKLNEFKGKETKESYTTNKGNNIGMPIYWRNKRYTEKEREDLWLIKLDQNIRWVCGEKIDISKGDENYMKILKWYQRKNTEIGYGNGEKDWEQYTYENERKMLKSKMRIKNKYKREKKTLRGGFQKDLDLTRTRGQ